MRFSEKMLNFYFQNNLAKSQKTDKSGSKTQIKGCEPVLSFSEGSAFSSIEPEKFMNYSYLRISL
jgi:hypothetical protein